MPGQDEDGFNADYSFAVAAIWTGAGLRQ